LTESETRERIDAQAAQWAARHALGEKTDADEAKFQAWLGTDRQHQGAYLRAQASYYAMEDAVLASPVPVASNDDERAPSSASARWRTFFRPALAAGLSVAACVTAAVLIRAPEASDAAERSAHETLADGSSVVFGPDGAVTAAIDGASRRITLERGSATFHVAKDRSRPFVVQSGQVYAEATGTVYSVQRVGRVGGAIRVSEGSVRVWAEGAREKAVMLQAGQALTLDPAAAQPTATARQDLWFDNVSIADAAARFNSVNAIQIVVADPAIGRVTIMGGFKPDRPAEFARAAAAITGAQVIARDGTLVIEKK
jgi:transmembrane sensor